MAEDFKQRLAESIEASGKKKKDVAALAGITSQRLSQYLSGRMLPKHLLMSRLARALGASERWLAEGIEDERRTVEVKFYGAADAAVKARRLEPGAYFLLPLVSGEVAAGPGAAVHEREIEDYIPSIYQRDWCPHPDKTVCVRVSGTSMESTIHDGGIVAVDRAQRDPRRLIGKVVALRRDGGVTVKRLTTAEGGLWIARPDNPQSPETLVFRDDEIVDAVVGKVVWSWSRMS